MPGRERRLAARISSGGPPAGGRPSASSCAAAWRSPTGNAQTNSMIRAIAENGRFFRTGVSLRRIRVPTVAAETRRRCCLRSPPSPRRRHRAPRSPVSKRTRIAKGALYEDVPLPSRYRAGCCRFIRDARGARATLGVNLDGTSVPSGRRWPRNRTSRGVWPEVSVPLVSSRKSGRRNNCSIEIHAQATTMRQEEIYQ